MGLRVLAGRMFDQQDGTAGHEAFLRRSLVPLAIGLTIGIAGAFGVGQLLKSLLVQTSARDPFTLTSIALLLTGVSLAACFLPARRATRLDPISALRYE
jgi:putative ABC transport system permease protein